MGFSWVCFRMAKWWLDHSLRGSPRLENIIDSFQLVILLSKPSSNVVIMNSNKAKSSLNIHFIGPPLSNMHVLFSVDENGEPVVKRMRIEVEQDSSDLKRQLEEVQRKAEEYKAQLQEKSEEAEVYKKQLSEISAKSSS